jgi:F0F1-type ATP synthase assembly protein I
MLGLPERRAVQHGQPRATVRIATGGRKRPAHAVAFLLSGRILSEALSNSELRQGRRQALAVVLAQGLLGAIVAIACLAVWGSRAGASALLGAAIGMTATSLMAFAMLRHGGSGSAQRVARSFFSGWLVKVAFTLALLVIAFRSPGVDAAALLAAYVATFFGYWFGAARLGGQKTKQPLGMGN